jgi:hypothetical protein
MTCQGYYARLDDYVDGALTPADSAQIEAHLATCPRCRSFATDLRNIRSMARSLELLAPPPRVWRAISAAAERQALSPATPWRRDSLSTSTVTPERRYFVWSALRGVFVTWQPAAATAMAAVLASGLWWLGDRLSTEKRTVVPPAALAAVGDAAFGDVTHRAAEAGYATTIAQLEALARAERDMLDPALVDVLDSGMVVIDRAIDQSRAAVQADPESNAAQQSLFQALRTKVALLQDTLTLANDRSRGEMAGQ